MKRSAITFLVVIGFVGMLAGQEATDYPDTIHLYNASFEGVPRSSMQPPRWTDCGFPGESAPDVQPFSQSYDSWAQTQQAHHGLTYLGMVVRDNDTWEKVSQRLRYPIESGKCYQFSVYLSTGKDYLSASQRYGTDSLFNYNQPAVLRVRGAEYSCRAGELLAETNTITNHEWQLYEFFLQPKASYNYLMLEAFYKTPSLFPYNGNILLDHASPIVRVLCPGEEEPVIAADEVLIEAEDEPAPIKNNPQSASTGTDYSSEEEQEIARERIMKSLQREKLRVGETIRIQKLTFTANSADLKPGSYLVLNEVADFLIEHDDVVVEIGGHTSLYREKNKILKRSYFQELSMDRAKAVYTYLRSKGVPEKRLSYRGYGYQDPVATNYTKEGRIKNQRVEIKILQLGS